MKIIALAAFALLLLPAVAMAENANSNLAHAAGVLLGLRSYATGIVQYCYDHVDARPEFTAAISNWNERNAADSASLDAVLATFNVPPEARDKMNSMIAIKIGADFDAASDKAAFCEKMLVSVNNTENDLAILHPDEMAIVRAAAAPK